MFNIVNVIGITFATKNNIYILVFISRLDKPISLTENYVLLVLLSVLELW